MSEDLGIQKQQPSALPYAAAGGVIGGAGAYFGTNHFVKPKYGSYEEIINNMDKDTFENTLKEADSDFVAAAKEVRDANATAEAKYQTELAAFQKEGAQVANENPEYKKLAETAADKQKALNAAEEKLVSAEIEKLKGSNVTTKYISIEEALNNKAKAIVDATKRYNKLVEKKAAPEEIKAAKEYVSKLEAEADKLATAISRKLDYRSISKDTVLKDLEEQLKKAKENFNKKYNNQKQFSKKEIDSARELVSQLESRIETIKNSPYLGEGFVEDKMKAVADIYRQNIKDDVNQRLANYEAPALQTEEATLVKNYAEKTKAINAQKEAYEKALQDIADIRGMKKLTTESVGNQSKIAADAERNQINRLEALKSALTEAKAKVQENAGKTGEYVIKGKIGNRQVELIVNGEVAPSIKDEINKYMETLKESDKKALEKLLKGDITEDTVNKAIEVTTKRQQTLYSAGQIIAEHDGKINTLKEEANNMLVELRTKVKDPKAYVKDGVLYNQKGEVIKTTVQAPKYVRPKINLPEYVGIPEDTVVKDTQKAAALSADELKAKASKIAEQNPEYKKLLEEYTTAETARKTAYDALPKTAATEAQFLEKQGVKDKAEYIAKEVEAKKNSFIEKYGKQLESKLGKNAGWKLAGITAAGLLLGGWIGSMFTPKNNA